jgi:monothiol glutaredoxin
MNQEIHELLSKNPVILFMKGDKYFPKCGYSKLAVEILNEYGIDYATFDILKDENIRQSLKDFSDWPTYPQFYYNSQFIGGSDILKEMHLAGELEQLFKS